MDRARELASQAGGSVETTADRRAAMDGAHVLYAKSWAAPQHYGRPAEEAALRAPLRAEWCVGEPWFDAAQPDAKFMHCLPVRRNVKVVGRGARRPAQRRRPAGRQPAARAEGAAGRDAREEESVNTPHDRDATMGALLRALPYIRLYRGRVFVLKLGGEAVADAESMRKVVEQVGVLAELGIRLVVVHGGGPQTTALAERLGLPTRIVGGRRVTTPETLEVAIMTMNGTVNTAVLAACRAAGIAAVGRLGRGRRDRPRPPTRAGRDDRRRRPDDDRLRRGRRRDVGRRPGAASGCSTPASSRSSARSAPTTPGTCSTSTPTPWPRRSPARWAPRS